METQFLLIFAFGQSWLSALLQRLLTGGGLTSGFVKLLDIIDDAAKDTKNKVTDIEVDADEQKPQFFEDYMEQYLKGSDGKWTRRHLLGDMAVMFIGATDTTYISLANALLLAAKYPHIQQELYEELTAAFGRDVDNIKLKTGLSKIPKLRAFIQESLRIYPPAGISGTRQVFEPGLVVEDGARKFEVRVGTQTVLNVKGINHNPKYWVRGYDATDPEHAKVNMDEIHFEFWLDKDGRFNKSLNSRNFFTFHVGKRDCVGQSLAIKQLILVLAMIFMRYHVSSPEGDDFEIGCRFTATFVLEPTNEEILLKLRS